MIGSMRVFEYPWGFTTLPDYSEHRGAIVKVMRELRPDEYDNQGECMYEIKAADGWVGQAWESELAEYKGEAQPVIFRVLTRKPQKGEVIALFPLMPEGNGLVNSYMHVGQHGAADYAGMIRQSRKATPAWRRCIESGQGYKRNGHTLHVGHFAIDEITPAGILKAGCHTISREELERMEALLGLTPVGVSA